MDISTACRSVRETRESPLALAHTRGALLASGMALYGRDILVDTFS